VFGPGRQPTSDARFLYFDGPDGMVFGYSIGIDEVEYEATYRARQIGFERVFECSVQNPSA
jgi:2,3-dihydroxy-p-cumate/2,3-dihydroxybenzoate 3,4-dioxygenase